MSEETNVPEESQEDGKSERPEEVNENISQQQTIEQSEAQIEKSEIPKSAIENMEVHHHPDLHHRRKNFKEYFLEFLMIFLAVTLGFFAEQIREDFADHSREKEYMKSMIEDLKSDTVLLSSNIRLRQQRNEMIDSLIYLLTSPFIKENGNTIYFFARSISPPVNIFPNDRTIQQLKSSGSLRLIRNLNVSDGIMAYDQKMRQYLFDQTDEIQIRGSAGYAPIKYLAEKCLTIC